MEQAAFALGHGTGVGGVFRLPFGKFRGDLLGGRCTGAYGEVDGVAVQLPLGVGITGSGGKVSVFPFAEGGTGDDRASVLKAGVWSRESFQRTEGGVGELATVAVGHFRVADVALDWT